MKKLSNETKGLIVLLMLIVMGMLLSQCAPAQDFHSLRTNGKKEFTHFSFMGDSAITIAKDTIQIQEIYTDRWGHVYLYPERNEAMFVVVKGRWFWTRMIAVYPDQVITYRKFREYHSIKKEIR